MKIAALVFGLVIGLTSLPQTLLAADGLLSQKKGPECYCTDRYGKRHEIGDIICLTVDGRSYEAKCVMAQNNPFWRDLDRGCLSASLPPWKTPSDKISPASNSVVALYQ